MERSHDELLGQTLNGTYSLEKLLGTGGMGSVYRARRNDSDQPVAIKVLRRELSSDVKQLKRLEREAQVASSLHHANIVRASEFSVVPGEQTFMVMEYVEGVSLRELLDRGEHLPASRVVRMAKQVLSALSAAHAAGVVHRDVKPANIMLTVVGGIGDFVKLLDFGIAKMLDGAAATKLTETGATLGTPHYMPPEQVMGGDVDHRSDLYALGVVLFETLSGQMPFEFEGLRDFIVKLTTEDPRSLSEVAPELPAELVDAVDKAIAPSPDDRYQSATEMADALADAPLTSSAPESLADTIQSPGVTPLQPSSRELSTPTSASPFSRTLPPRIYIAGAIAAFVVILTAGVFVGTTLFDSLQRVPISAPAAGDRRGATGPPIALPSNPIPPPIPQRTNGGVPSVASQPAEANQAIRLGPGRYGPIACDKGTKLLHNVTIDAPGGPAIFAIGSCQITIVDSSIKGTSAIFAAGSAVIRVKNSSIVGKVWSIRAAGSADVNVDGGMLRGLRGAASLEDDAFLRTTNLTTIVGKIFVHQRARHNGQRSDHRREPGNPSSLR